MREKLILKCLWYSKSLQIRPIWSVIGQSICNFWPKLLFRLLWNRPSLHKRFDISRKWRGVIHRAEPRAPARPNHATRCYIQPHARSTDNYLVTTHQLSFDPFKLHLQNWTNDRKDIEHTGCLVSYWGFSEGSENKQGILFFRWV